MNMSLLICFVGIGIGCMVYFMYIIWKGITAFNRDILDSHEKLLDYQYRLLKTLQSLERVTSERYAKKTKPKEIVLANDFSDKD